MRAVGVRQQNDRTQIVQKGSDMGGVVITATTSPVISRDVRLMEGKEVMKDDCNL